MRALLQHLKPGTRFRVEETGATGVLVKASECRAVVRLDAAVETVEFVDGQGAHREFVSRRTHEISWSPNVLVTPLGWEELTMAKKAATKKATKAAAAKKTTKPAADKPVKVKKERMPKADGKLSQLDAAVKVLGESQEPMTTKPMVEAMAAQLEVDDHQAAQPAVKEQEVDPVPFVIDPQPPLTDDEGEVTAQLHQERFQVLNERLFQVALGVFVFEVQEFEEIGVFDLLIRGHEILRAWFLPPDEQGCLFPRQQRPFVKLRADLAFQLTHRPAAANCFGFVELARHLFRDRQQPDVVRPGQRETPVQRVQVRPRKVGRCLAFL